MECKAKLYPIETGKPIVVLNEEDAKDLGVYASGRVAISYMENKTTAIVNITKTFVEEGEIGIFDEVRKSLEIKEGDKVELSITKRPESVDFIKKKITGEVLHGHEIRSIIQDIVDNNLSDVELSAFVTGGYIKGYNMDEIVALTNSMVETGQQIDFGDDIVDKHCIGGVAGNRTTMLIVPIIAACGLIIPKTSSRAITSPSGTADTMEVLADVEFNIDELKDIVNKTNSCIVWGGAINLAPADDKIIKVEYPLSIDTPDIVLASVMAKKKSVGSDYVLVDIPVGKGAKVSNMKDANYLANRFIELGKRLEISLECLVTDGTSPIGSGIGPALEAKDIIMALENKGPTDLISKSLEIAGILLELSGNVHKGKGKEIAEKMLTSGEANKKMREIIDAQNGNSEITVDDIQIGGKEHTVKSDRKGRVRYIDNKLISGVARVAGAPKDNGAGIYLHVKVGDAVGKNDELFTIYSENNNKMNDAIKLANKTQPIKVGGVILDILR